MSMPPVAILCGGLGTRLGEETRDKPKSLVDVAGKPFIIRQLELLKSQGVAKVVLCLGHLDRQIIHGLGNLTNTMDIKWSVDGPALLGTAGAIRKALPLLGDEFFVLYGDSYLECDYEAVQKAFRDSDKLAMMTVCLADSRDTPNTTVGYHGRITWHHKSMWDRQSRHLDYGLGVFKADAFKIDSEPDLSVLYQNLAAKWQLAAYEVPMLEHFREIGSPEGLAELRVYLGKTKDYPIYFVDKYMGEVAAIADKISMESGDKIERIVDMLIQLRERVGRLFILGVGGSAANASHAVNDFRKICGIETYCPTDNVAELTARTNDDGWDTVFLEWLITSHASTSDMILVLSVGGGTMEASYCIAKVLCVLAHRPQVVGIVGRNGGYTAEVAEECLVIPTVNPEHVTPHAEAFQSIILHLLVSHPRLQP